MALESHTNSKSELTSWSGGARKARTKQMPLIWVGQSDPVISWLSSYYKKKKKKISASWEWGNGTLCWVTAQHGASLQWSFTFPTFSLSFSSSYMLILKSSLRFCWPLLNLSLHFDSLMLLLIGNTLHTVLECLLSGWGLNVFSVFFFSLVFYTRTTVWFVVVFFVCFFCLCRFVFIPIKILE